jgi:protocatechuate 3,4-dioxygenase beta subunit
MKSPLATLLAVPLALALHAQTPSATAEKAVIEGRVVRAGTGEPLKKAWVILRKAEGWEAKGNASSDAEGRFKLEGIEPGRYRLLAGRNGYVQREYGQRGPARPGATLTLAPGQRLDDVVFELIPAAVIAGRVYDEDGELTPGVLVEALRYQYLRDRRELVTVGRASSDDRGEYRIFGLEPGTYYVSATHTPWMSFVSFGTSIMFGEGPARAADRDEGYAPTYFPGTNDPGAATALEVRAGDELGSIDFLLLPTRTVRVRGRVFNAVTGRPGRGAMVSLVPAGRTSAGHMIDVSRQVEQPDGSFELGGVVPGSYVLRAWWHEEQAMYSGRTEIEVGPVGLDNVSVTITAGVEVRGRVRVERAAAGRDPSGATANALDPTTLHVNLEPKEEALYFGGGSARLKGDFTFLMNNVSEGDYRVSLFGAPPDYYLKAARLGGEDVLEGGLSITGGAMPEPLELTLSPNGARLEGVVLAEDNEPFSGAVVALVPEKRRHSRSELYKAVATDQHGRFLLRGLPPGEYKLFAWEEIERGAYRDPEFLKPYEDRGQEVRLHEGEAATAELKLIRSGEAAQP